MFDSGVGGLTVLKAVRDKFSRLDLVYLGDTARVPYGNKSKETVIRYSLECAEFLVSKGVEVLVVACNTASSQAMEALKDSFDIPIIGVVEPGVNKALGNTQGRVGVIGTRATIRSGAYQELLEKAGVEVFSKACPLFVPLVEEGLLEGDIARRVVEMYLSEFREKEVDTLILGCTHYPLLKNLIQDFLPGTNVVDSSEAVASELEGFVKDEGSGITELYFTDRSQNLENLIETILGEPMEIRVLTEGLSRVSG